MIVREMIYDAPQEQFFQDVRLNRFADIVRDNFSGSLGWTPGHSEYNSWVATGDKIKNLLESAELSDVHVAFEYQVPYTQKRIDCMLFGTNAKKHGVIVHIEMKQWEKVEPLDIEGNFVETYVGGGMRKEAHPSQQVQGYHNYLVGFVEVFEAKDIGLIGCAYCHNYRSNIGEGLFDPIYEPILTRFPLYTHDDVLRLAERLKELLSEGKGLDIFNKFMQSPVKPSKKLLESAGKIIDNQSDMSLLNDQIFARNEILGKIHSAERNNETSVIIVKGGPGTGKTVIALHILAHVAAKGRSVFFSSKSKSLLEAIKYKVRRKDANVLFSNLNQFVPSRMGQEELDVLIVDEAHRIGNSSNMQFTKPQDRTDMPQVDQLIRCAKTSVFFIDDLQATRFLDVGSVELIKLAAKKYRREIREVELVSQFRCAGSDNYLAWLESILGHAPENIMYDVAKDAFEFRIVDSPEQLYRLIVEKDALPDMNARLTAGFCWKWSKKLDADGALVKDVSIGDFAMPWETHSKVTPPKGYVRWYEWAYKPEGIKQVGCIYTAQGFEFDYVGVIVGP
ncbi:ATP/GTP-binding protein, partial [Candidatus Woesearchaeota archaeon CG_4_10_14_0_2_um_filter_57_5]